MKHRLPLFVLQANGPATDLSAPVAFDEDSRWLFYRNLRYILDPADVKGPDYPLETFRVVKEKEIRQHGKYCTRRLVLEAWDRMETNSEFTAMGM